MIINLIYYFWFFIFVFLSFVFFYIGFFFFVYDYSYFYEFSLYYCNSLNLSYIMIFDWMSLIFVSLVMFISSMVILYSFYYIGVNSYSCFRFFYILIIFIFSMMLMILSPSMLSIMLGWDGLGLVSYCLVIYYNSNSSLISGMLTCLTNRLGDFGLLICSCWVVSYGSWHFIYYLDFFNNYIFFLLIFSCFTSSAQIPFSSWLPSAMSAPTPISSLVHSSTLVTAGVYLIIRFSLSICLINYFFIYISLITMFMSSFCAFFEFDLSKIIALSTLSQLGLMMFTLFMGLPLLSFVHLLNHAMFKSLLFLCSGVIIYFLDNNQDIRCLGMFSKMMPFTSCCFMISLFSLMGLPYMSGFYSKDLIIDNLMMMNFNYLLIFLFFFSIGLTSLYSVRLLYYCLFMSNIYNSYMIFIDQFNYMSLSIFFLTIFSVLVGCVLNWILMLNISYIIIPLYMKIFTFSFILLLFWLSLEFSLLNFYFFTLNYYNFNSNMWFISSYFNYGFSFFYKVCYLSSFKMLYWGEYYGYYIFTFYLYSLVYFIQFYMLINFNIFMFFFLIFYLFLF
uniref:NADH dehydrogenase subunit 5 n=1 Tax=Krisna quadrimaculosus TaxID=3041591 RepID=UPI002552086E|nr:NADH dehydrogenase subunit 5 [Krisna quadrimaculosus]WGG89453.1 NADH dehydrogenase subunit 5 [Krisna quadrimaculosus]